MKMHRSSFTAVPLSLFVAMTAALQWWGSAPAGADTEIMTSTTTSTSTSSTTTATTTPAWVSIKGTVSGAPESVAFSGQAKLTARVVTDPDFGAVPTVVLSIDLSGVTGVGSSTGKTYVNSNQEIVNRRLTAADMVQLTFPFYPSGTSTMAARVGMASFNLRFDVNTLKLTAASGSIGSP
jgi:hypothetical protein